MSASTMTRDRRSICRRIADVQATWSPEHRLQRAIEGRRRRFDEFLNLIRVTDTDPRMRVVTAPEKEVARRLAS
jgi:hypothetical protein